MTINKSFRKSVDDENDCSPQCDQNSRPKYLSPPPKKKSMIKVTLLGNFNVFGLLTKALIRQRFQSDCCLSAIGFAHRLANSTKRRTSFDGSVGYTSPSAVAVGVVVLNSLYKHTRQSHFYQFVVQLSKIIYLFKITPEISGQKLAAFKSHSAQMTLFLHLPEILKFV